MEEVKFPRISIVTVNLNNSRFLEQTIRSVLDQGYPNLEYIIIDGGSTDQSVDIIRNYQERISYWVSEPDEGQYHALMKGFARCTGDIMGWINSDDFYQPFAFQAVLRIMQQYPDVQWLMGIPGEYNSDGTQIRRINLSWGRWSRLRYLTNDFQFIQQESVFWKRELWEKSGGTLDLSYRYAADMELWSRFFRHTKLHTTLAQLSGFRHHDYAQRSNMFRDFYLNECMSIVKRERKEISFYFRVFYPLLRLIGLFTGFFFYYDIPILNLIHPLLFNLPPVIGFDFETGNYVRHKYLVKHPPMMLFGKQIHFGILWKFFRK